MAPLVRPAMKLGAGLRRCEPLSAIAAAGTLLTLAVIVASASLRLLQIGLGCEPWPACYGTPAAAPDSALVVALRGAHRLAAGAVAVLAVLALAYAWPQRAQAPARAWAAGAVVALTLFLAVFGLSTRASAGVGIAVTNVSGGMAMLALFAWLAIAGVARPARRRPGWWLAGVLLGTAIVLGVATSAALAGRACPGLFVCEAALAADGYSMRSAQAALQLAHRATGLAAAIAIGVLALATWRRRGRGRARIAAAVVGIVVALQLGLGAMLIVLDLPLAIALAHSAGAALAVAASVACARYGSSADDAAVSSSCQM